MSSMMRPRAGRSGYTPPPFSVNEVATGETWIDGSPVYRVVVQGTTPENVNVIEYTSIPDQIHTVISAEGFIDGGNGEFTIFNASNGTTTAALHMIAVIRNNDAPSNKNAIGVGVGSPTYTSKAFHMTLKYTKA